MLDIPHFRETYREKKRSGFWNLFGSDSKKQEETRTDRHVRGKEANNQADVKSDNPKDEESKSNIWKKIKDALRKKE